LRKFKRIFKREMAENPDRYEISKPSKEEESDESSSSSSDAEEKATLAKGADTLEG